MITWYYAIVVISVVSTLTLPAVYTLRGCRGAALAVFIRGDLAKARQETNMMWESHNRKKGS